MACQYYIYHHKIDEATFRDLFFFIFMLFSYYFVLFIYHVYLSCLFSYFCDPFFFIFIPVFLCLLFIIFQEKNEMFFDSFLTGPIYYTLMFSYILNLLSKIDCFLEKLFISQGDTASFNIKVFLFSI